MKLSIKEGEKGFCNRTALLTSIRHCQAPKLWDSHLRSGNSWSKACARKILWNDRLIMSVLPFLQVVILKSLLERNQGLVSEAVRNHRCLSDYNWLQHPPPPRSTKRPWSEPVSYSLNSAPMPVAGISRVDGILTCVDSLKLLGVNKEGGVEQNTFSEKENRPLLAQSLHVPFVMLATDSNA